MNEAIKFEQWYEREGSMVAGSFQRNTPTPAPTQQPKSSRKTGQYATPLPPTSAPPSGLIEANAAAYRDTYTQAWQRESPFAPQPAAPKKQPARRKSVPPPATQPTPEPLLRVQTGGQRNYVARQQVEPEPEYAQYEMVQEEVRQAVRRPRTGFLAATTAAVVLAATLFVGMGQMADSSKPVFGGISGGGVSATGQLTAPQLTTIAEHPVQPKPQAQPPQPANGQAMRHPGADSHDLRGLPSISVATIERVLKAYNSPAQGLGQTIYDLGIKYGVDPAYAVAFYVHESSAGTQGMATITHSFGNIRCVKGYKCYNVNGGYTQYDNIAQGAEHWYILITGELYIGDGLVTPEQITHRYAPSGDNNDPNSYANVVNRLVAEWRASE